MKRTLSLIAIIALAVPAGIASAATGSGEDLVLATVNEETITLQDLRDMLGGRHAGHANVLTGEEVIRSVVDKAVEERLLIREGRRLGIREKPGFEQAITVYRDTLLLDVLEKRYLGNLSEAGDEEIDRAYDLMGRQVRVGLIQTRVADDARYARLRVMGGEAFDEVARQVSIHGSRARGGEIGWVTWGMLDPATEKAALETSVGSVSDPFEVDEGHYRIVRVLEEKAGYPPAKEQAVGKIRAIITSREMHEQKRSLLEQIMKAHPPTIDEVALRKLLSSPDPDAAAPNDPVYPDDTAMVMTTVAGLPVSAGYIRERARKSGLSLQASWVASRDDALLIDEARRRVKVDEEIRRKLDIFADQRVRAEVENVAVSGLQITEESVRKVYENDPNAFVGPASYQIRHIVLSTREDALEVHRLLDEGGDFDELVRERSVDLRTKDRGGDLGWIDVAPDDSIDEMSRAIFALGPGQHTGVMKTKLGHAIVQVLSIRPPLVPPYEQVRDAAARLLFTRHRDAFIARLRDAAEIEMMEENITKAVAIQERLVTSRADTDSPQAP